MVTSGERETPICGGAGYFRSPLLALPGKIVPRNKTKPDKPAKKDKPFRSLSMFTVSPVIFFSDQGQQS
jgi:hypothetical protein